MNIFGIGTAELAIIFVLMLMVAGPKRMAQWAYVLGQYVAKLRTMWQETSKVIRAELEAAGVEPEVVDTLEQYANPRSRPSVRNAMSQQLDNLVKTEMKPVDDALKPVGDVMQEVKKSTPLAGAQADGNSQSTDSASGDKPASDTKASQSDAEDSAGTYDAWTKPN
jgi:Sec-independent protein translocase protein TatA